MRHPSSDKRAAQFMFASPRSAKHVRTSSCAKALARMSYTRGLASFFIVATPALNVLRGDAVHQAHRSIYAPCKVTLRTPARRQSRTPECADEGRGFERTEGRIQ